MYQDSKLLVLPEGVFWLTRGILGKSDNPICISQLSYCWDTISNTYNLKEDRFTLEHGSRGWVHGWWHQGRNIMVEGHDGAKVLTSWKPGSRERREEPRAKTHPPKARPKWHASSNLLTVHLNYELTNESIPWQVQHLHDPVTLQKLILEDIGLLGSILDLNYNTSLKTVHAHTKIWISCFFQKFRRAHISEIDPVISCVA